MFTNRIAFICCLFVLPLAFQNCSEEVGFISSSVSGADAENMGSGNIDSNDNSNGDPVGGQGTNGEDPENPTITPPTIVTGNVIRPEDPNFESCESFQELVDNENPIQLQPKSGNNICYYMKIFNESPGHSSGSLGEQRATDVLSSNHNGNFASYIGPFVMGDKIVNIASGGMGWKATLSGAFNDPTKKLAIDNYFMVHITSMQNNELVELTSAFGTADAVPGDSMPILYGQLGVEFTAFASGGTALVEAIGLETSTDAYTLRVRGLDCGAWARMKDTYLVFH